MVVHQSGPRKSPLPLTGRGWGWGEEIRETLRLRRRCSADQPAFSLCDTPTPNPSPQGGGESHGAWRTVQRHPGVGRDPVHFATIVWVAAGLLILFCLLTPARAVQPDEILKNPALETRARKISQELRCLVCQNQSIDDSNAELARDLRVIVRERIAAGDSDGQVLAFVEKRYGEFVLLRPRLAPHTLVLWLAPLLLLLGAAAVLFRRARWRPASGGDAREPAALTPAEQKRLDELLAQRDR